MFYIEKYTPKKQAPRNNSSIPERPLLRACCTGVARYQQHSFKPYTNLHLLLLVPFFYSSVQVSSRGLPAAPRMEDMRNRETQGRRQLGAATERVVWKVRRFTVRLLKVKSL